MAMVLFVFAGCLLTIYFWNMAQPLTDEPIYPRSPDITPPYVDFVPHTAKITAIPNTIITVNIIVHDTQNEIADVVVWRYDIAADGETLENQTQLIKDINYLVFKPGTNGYERKIFSGSYSEERLRWSFTARDINIMLHVVPRDGVGNSLSYEYKFRVEAVQNAPVYYLNEPDNFVMDESVIPVELIVTNGSAQIRDIKLKIDSVTQSSLVMMHQGVYSTTLMSANIPTGLHTLEVTVVLRSGIELSIYTTMVNYNPSLIPSVAPFIAGMCIVFGVIILLIRREKRPEEEKTLAGIHGKVYVREKEGKK
jgi:hypothetical protein